MVRGAGPLAGPYLKLTRIAIECRKFRVELAESVQA